ncbi:hypothetical protein BV25DRAFT_1781063, partial [Artomyces pyxidatus]
PQDEEIVALKAHRPHRPGFSAKQVSVLALPGKLGWKGAPMVDVRLDSCADVTLISEQCYKSLPGPPKLSKGMRVQLSQLTVGDGAQSLGFIRLPIFFPVRPGLMLKVECEAYVVPDMTVPVLLGEDFHLNYELSVSRNLETGTIVEFQGTSFRLPARAIHRRAKNKRRRTAAAVAKRSREIRAIQDYRIPPDSIKTIQVEGSLLDDRQWLVERSLLSSGREDVFVTPNTLFSAASPFVQVANTTPLSRFIRKGDVVGTIIDPAEFFDSPKDLSQLERMVEHSSKVAALIA